MVLKRGLYLAILIALLIIFTQLGVDEDKKQSSNGALTSFYNATIYNIGDEYLKVKADKILRYSNQDELQNVLLNFLDDTKKAYKIKANKAIMKEEIMTLSGNVVCDLIGDGILSSEQLIYNPKTKMLYNFEAFKVEYISHTLRGDNLVLNSSSRHFDALNTKFVLKVPKANAND